MTPENVLVKQCVIIIISIAEGLFIAVIKLALLSENSAVAKVTKIHRRKLF